MSIAPSETLSQPADAAAASRSEDYLWTLNFGPQHLIAGNSYWIVHERNPASTTDNCIGWSLATSNQYDAGISKIYSSSSWNDYPNREYHFKTYSIDFFDDFEDGDRNGWIDVDAGAGGYSNRDVDTERGGNCTDNSLNLTGGDEAHNTGMTYNLGSEISPTYLSYWIRSATDDRSCCFVVFYPPGTTDPLEAVFYNYLDSGPFMNLTHTNSITYTADTWYFVEFRNINWTAKTFDGYVDGASFATGVSFRNTSAASINKIHFYSYQAGADCWIDELIIR